MIVEFSKMMHLSVRAGGDFANYLACGGGTVVAVFGAVDANMVQAWGGAVVAVTAALWGLWRDNRRKDQEEQDRLKKAVRHERWDAFITAHRMEAIAKTGKDPFEQGAPPLDFLERIEQQYAKVTSSITTGQAGQAVEDAKKAEDAKPEAKPTDEPAKPKPRWPKIRGRVAG